MADFTFSKEIHQMPKGIAVVRGARTSNGGRDKKHVFIEVECAAEEAGAVQQALAIILQRNGRINATSF